MHCNIFPIIREYFNILNVFSIDSMPISTPPQNYALDPTGTSGTPVGPEILIVDDDLKVCAVGQKGNIFVRGPPCFGKSEQSTNSSWWFTRDLNG